MKVKMVRGVALILGWALAGVMMIPSAQADPWNKKTIVTINEPVEVSGTVLDPGRYVFQLADSQSNRHIVQIWTGDGMYLIATVLAIPAHRPEASDQTILNYDERPASQPMALRQWFYPGDNMGQEFVYHYRYLREPREERSGNFGH